MRRLARALQYAGIVAVSVLAAIVAAELVLESRQTPRAALPFYNIPYPYVMFRPPANAAYVTAETYAMSHHESRVFHYTNGDGFRVPSPGYALPREKPAGQLRIAVLGGSAVALGSTFDATLPGALKRVLRKRYPGRDVEVIDAGIVSCVSRQSIAQLVFSVAEYHPDIVILYDGVNDIGMPLTYDTRPNFPYNFETMQAAWDEYREARRAPLLRLLLDRSALAEAFRRHGAARPLAPGAPPGTRTMTPAEVRADPRYVSKFIAAYLSNWETLVRLSAAYHFKAVCVLQPTGGLDRDYALPLTIKDRLSKEAALDWMSAFGVLYGEADRQVARFGAAHPGVPVLNLRDSLHPARLYFWDLVHVYDETNLLLAERIAAAISGLTAP